MGVNRGMYVDSEAEAAAELAQLGDAGLGMMPEVKVAAFVQAADAENLDEDASDKLLRREAGERCVEWQHDNGVNAGGGKQWDTAGHGSEQFGRAGGAEEPLRVGVESDGDGAEAEGARFSDDGREDFLVAEVDAVEVADGGDNGSGGRWKPGELAVDIQGVSERERCRR